MTIIEIMKQWKNCPQERHVLKTRLLKEEAWFFDKEEREEFAQHLAMHQDQNLEFFFQTEQEILIWLDTEESIQNLLFFEEVLF